LQSFNIRLSIIDIPLSKDNLIALKNLHKKTKNKKQADRIKIILLFNNGYTQKEIASNILINENTISDIATKKWTIS